MSNSTKKQADRLFKVSSLSLRVGGSYLKQKIRDFLEEEGDDLVGTVRRVAEERGSTYIFVGTPDESRRREIFGGSLLSRMVRELPGIDIRVVASRADRTEADR